MFASIFIGIRPIRSIGNANAFSLLSFENLVSFIETFYEMSNKNVKEYQLNSNGRCFMKLCIFYEWYRCWWMANAFDMMMESY